MEKEAIGKAESIVLAQKNACMRLGVDQTQVKFEVLQVPVKKTLGLFGGKLAKVRAFIPDQKENLSDIAQNYIESIIKGMNLNEIKIEKKETNNGVDFQFNGIGIGTLIGKRGETLEAIQYLCGLVVNKKQGDFFKIKLNASDYREKREKTLSELGIKTANRSLKYAKNIVLEPMNPYERKIIHSAVQNIDEIESWSEGENMYRHVVIGKKEWPTQNRFNSYHKTKNYNSFKP